MSSNGCTLLIVNVKSDKMIYWEKGKTCKIFGYPCYNKTKRVYLDSQISMFSYKKGVYL